VRVDVALAPGAMDAVGDVAVKLNVDSVTVTVAVLLAVP
jgi:hypothetical protein